MTHGFSKFKITPHSPSHPDERGQSYGCRVERLGCAPPDADMCCRLVVDFIPHTRTLRLPTDLPTGG